MQHKTAATFKTIKWLLPLLLLIFLIVFRNTLGTEMLAVGIGIELLLVLFGFAQAFRISRKYKLERNTGETLFPALEKSLEAMVPTVVARIIVQEFKIFYSIWAWSFRHKKLAGDEFSYHKNSIIGTFFLGMAILTPVEIVFFELLIPFVWLKWVLLIASIYGLFWIVGFYASLVVFPYKCREDGLEIHYGLLADGFIPYSSIAKIEIKKRNWDAAKFGPFYKKEDKTLAIIMEGRTDITIVLKSPIHVTSFIKQYKPTTVYLAADNPYEFFKEIKRFSK